MPRRMDRISVVIPTYNERHDLLRKSIDTILNQTYPNIQLIVVDDGSLDDTGSGETWKDRSKVQDMVLN